MALTFVDAGHTGHVTSGQIVVNAASMPSGVLTGDLLILTGWTAVLTDERTFAWGTPSAAAGAVWTLGGTSSYLAIRGDTDFAWVWWWCEAAIDSPLFTQSVPISGDYLAAGIKVVAVRGQFAGAAPTVTVHLDATPITAGGTFTPDGVQATADGMFVGSLFVYPASGAGGSGESFDSDPTGWPCISENLVPDGWFGGWCTAELVDGPLALAAGPVTFSSGIPPSFTAQWLTFWVSAVGGGGGGGESTYELCVPVRDFPTSGTGTISGRPSLLCAVYEIWVLDRRTQATIVKLPARGHTLTFGYRSGVSSDASLVVDYGAIRGQVNGDDCCGRLGRVGEWMHELVVKREGNTEEVWGGPIVGVEDDPRNGTLTISAKDRSAWWWERFLPYNLIYQGAKQDAAKVFVDLLRAADQPQSYLGRTNSGGVVLPHDPVGLLAYAYPTGVMVDAKVLLQSDDVIVGEEIASLTSAVLDWTVIGRRAYIGALVVNLAPLPLLRQEHWVEVDPVVARNGIGVATKVVVRGSGSVRGEYPPGQIVTPRWPQYGSHGKKILDSTITDVGVATERARQEWERWQQPNFQVLTSNGTLGPKAPVTVEDLIPGRAMQIAITEGCMPTSLRLAEQRVGGRIQYYAYDSGQVQPLVVAQRLLQTDVTVVDSVEDEVKIDTQALGTEVRSRSAT